MQWRIIEEFPNYEVSEYGDVRNIKRGSLVTPHYLGDGYPSLQLYKNGKRWFRRVPRLVAIAFVPNPDNKPQVNHIDGDITNSHYSNLEWTTGEENLEHARINKLLSKASKVVVQYDRAGNYIQEFESATLAAKSIEGCHVSSITCACTGYSKTAKGYVWRYKNAD
jgi:hypothetical protein